MIACVNSSCSNFAAPYQGESTDVECPVCAELMQLVDDIVLAQLHAERDQLRAADAEASLAEMAPLAADVPAAPSAADSVLGAINALDPSTATVADVISAVKGALVTAGAQPTPQEA